MGIEQNTMRHCVDEISPLKVGNVRALIFKTYRTFVSVYTFVSKILD